MAGFSGVKCSGCLLGCSGCLLCGNVLVSGTDTAGRRKQEVWGREEGAVLDSVTGAPEGPEEEELEDEEVATKTPTPRRRSAGIRGGPMEAEATTIGARMEATTTGHGSPSRHVNASARAVRPIWHIS